MRRYLVTTGALFALLGAAHWLRTFADWQRLTDEPGFIVEGPGIGAVATALAIWAWRLHRSLAGRPGG
jgi:hypothetical protein